MDKSEFQTAWKDIGWRAQSYFNNYLRHPTMRNGCYMTGYVTALWENSVIRQDTYSLLLALIGRISESEIVRDEVKNLLED